jgi:Ca2+-binding EF-hand superfamily protein
LHRSGFIDVAEFIELLKYLKVPMSRDDAAAVFMVLDSNGDGEMSQQEFEDYWVANMRNTSL